MGLCDFCEHGLLPVVPLSSNKVPCCYLGFPLLLSPQQEKTTSGKAEREKTARFSVRNLMRQVQSV